MAPLLGRPGSGVNMYDRPPPAKELRTRLPSTFVGLACGLVRRISQCSGAFASYLRSAERFVQGAQRGVLESTPQKRGESALFPLPLPPTKGAGGAAEHRLPPNGRARSRALKRRAVRQLQAAMVHFLNFEASGRKREATPTTRPNASEAQKRALACLEGAARAMLCAEVQRCHVATLALGRGKIAAGRDAVAMIRKRVSEIALKDGGYRISAKVAELQHVPDADRGEDVDIFRVKFVTAGVGGDGASRRIVDADARAVGRVRDAVYSGACGSSDRGAAGNERTRSSPGVRDRRCRGRCGSDARPCCDRNVSASRARVLAIAA